MKKYSVFGLYGRPLLAVVIASCLFLALYQWDNTYTHPAVQPAEGLLVLSQNDLQQHPIRYLVNGWAFYPDVLLTPEDLRPEAPPRYLFYTAIGEHTRLGNVGNPKQPHGGGTYLLRLILPQEVQTYTLELPEVFSAYRLYIDDKLVLQLGDPDPENFRDEIQSRKVTFETGGSVTFLLSVSDYAHFYSGLVYPPAFGLGQAVERASLFRLGGKLAIVTIALLAALLSLYLGWAMKHRNALLFSLLCLAMSGATAYPLVHAFALLPVQPWYALELLCGYAVTLLVVVLHNRICKVDHRTMIISNTAAILICLKVFFYGLLSAHLTVPMMQVHSLLIDGYKAMVAVYLLITAYRSVRKNIGASPLFFAAILYATAFVWDRILPDYNPILGGWFLEWGSFGLVLAVGYTLWRDLMDAYRFRLTFAEENRQVTRQLAIQQAHYLTLTEKIETTVKWQHDQRHHLQTLLALTKAGELARLQEYLSNCLLPVEHVQWKMLCKNLIIDAIFQYYSGLCKGEGIHFAVKEGETVPSDLSIEGTDLSIVCGNLIENAYEACLLLKAEQPQAELKIKIFISIRDEKLLLRIENSMAGSPVRQNGRYLSSKHEGYGIGTESVKMIVNKYDGMLRFKAEHGLFRVSVVLPLV